MHETFAMDTNGVSNLGKAIVEETQAQLHIDPYNYPNNLDDLTSKLNSSIQQLPTTIANGTSQTTGVQKFVSDFSSNYSQLLNQRIVIGQILEGKVAPDVEQQELQINDSFQ